MYAAEHASHYVQSDMAYASPLRSAPRSKEVPPSQPHLLRHDHEVKTMYGLEQTLHNQHDLVAPQAAHMTQIYEHDIYGRRSDADDMPDIYRNAHTEQNNRIS